MRAVSSIIKTDLILIGRNKIALYMALAPALLAFVYLAVLGGVSDATITFVLPAEAPGALQTQLQRLAKVETVADQTAVVQRVERVDSAAGVVWQAGQPALIVEGNEPEGFASLAGNLLQRALAGGLPAHQALAVTSSGGRTAELAVSSLLLLAVFIAGAVSGFNIVAERESKSLQALGVAPLTLGKYVAARTLLALALALINTAATALVIGKMELLPQLLVAALCSAGLVGLVAVIFGYTANNQITAIASLKLMMPVALAIPLSSLFVSARLQWLYYWMPNYWQLKAFQAAWAGEYDLVACALLAATGFVWLLLLRRPIKRRFGLR